MMTRILFAAGLMLLVSLCSANARPRDDVMTGLFRCNGLESDRQWLDCYYGAAQPARVTLGLKPALPSQLQLAQSLPAASQAQPSVLRTRVVAEAGRCYDQDGDRAWLDCYYRAAVPMRQQLGLAVAPGQSAALPPPRDDFGITKPAQVVATQSLIRDITSRMTAYSFDAQNVFTVRLENGQTWRQLDGDGGTARWQKPPGTYLVTIRRGMSRSFIMTIDNDPHIFRVHRIN
jgi:hypothetical protein